MNRILTYLMLLVTAPVCAGVSVYTFVSPQWTSTVGAEECDPSEDGWLSDQDAYSYDKGRYDQENRLMDCGVSVKKSTTGAGATSVKTFTDVRKITVNFCQNSSKGKGVIYFQVGENTPDSIVVHKPAQSEVGRYNRDSVVVPKKPLTGKIRFWVTCTENSINIHTITIRHSGGGSSPFTMDTYQLVTDTAQLQEGDPIMIGVKKEGVNYVMGYYDETVSQNNIHAIRGTYTEDRNQVSPNEEAIYTLHKTELDSQTVYYIQDELRYETAYLVASGGQTKNRLALWDKLTDEKTYGNYGYWAITIQPDGEATIMNKGNSKGKYLQYNATNNPTLFGCYPDLSQTAVAIYRCTKALGDTTAIVAPLVNFGQVPLTEGEAKGDRTILVQGNKLEEDITLTWKSEDHPFTLSATTIDRDGDYVTIRYSVTEGGAWHDTLVLTSGAIRTEVSVMLTVKEEVSVAQAVHEPDYTMVWLNDVVVTKKYDTYIFVRDSSGSMLIYDAGDGTGDRYGSGLKNGHVLQGVQGRMRNYFGVPEMIPTKQWTVAAQKEDCQPDTIDTDIDSSMVCRYIRLNQVVVDEWNMANATYLTPTRVVDAFDTGIKNNENTQLDAIVMLSWDELQLWCVRQEDMPTAVENTLTEGDANAKVIRNGQLLIYNNHQYYTLLGCPL